MYQFFNGNCLRKHDIKLAIRSLYEGRCALIKVYTAQNPLEAHIVRNRLEAEGIACIIRGASLWSARGELPVTSDTLPTIWLYDDADLETAQAIIAGDQEFEMADEFESGEWRCLSCGEHHEPQFTLCWKCGSERL